jgi:3' terminal RNA ribose 2'-O-methyltransferase Hen1
MLLTITTSHQPATDLGHLLRKNPGRPQSVDLSFGRAHVFYTEATGETCTAALLLDVDPVGLVRGRQGPSGAGGALDQYVNDRPYVASSFLSVAIARVFGSALGGRSAERPELAETPIPLTARIAVLPVRGGETFLRRLFEPLGYRVTVARHTLDERFPEWGESRYYSVELEHIVRLKDLLSHLYVLVPVLDDEKHYWVGDDEVEKLMRHGAAWLPGHPERDAIARRYLKYRPNLAREAIARLSADEGEDPDAVRERNDAEEEVVERRLGLNERRIAAVVEALRLSGAKRVLDLGCGEGRLVRALLGESSFAEIVGVDVSHRALEAAAARLRLDRMPERQRARVQLLHGSLTYRDARLAGYDAAAVVEVIEHLDLERLAAFERILFDAMRPRTVVVTTPNAEYNAKFESLPPGALRHKDHRFEWNRVEFGAWAAAAAGRFGYSVAFAPIGDDDPNLGPPTQMAVFTRMEAE